MSDVLATLVSTLHADTKAQLQYKLQCNILKLSYHICNCEMKQNVIVHAVLPDDVQ